MDFGFIQVAAPASQPAPLTDSSVSADLAADVAGAFDAALAATLGPVNVGTEPGAAAGGRAGQQPAWLLASLFAPTVTAFDVTAAAVTTTEEVGAAEEESIPADVPGDEESSDELVAVPVDAAVAIPFTPEIKPSTSLGTRNAVVPQGGPVADGGIVVTGEQAQPAAARAQSQPAAAGSQSQPAAAGAQSQPLAATAQSRVSDAGFEGAAAGGRVPAAAAAHAVKTQAVPANAPVLAALPNAPITQDAAVSNGVETTNAPGDQPVNADAVTALVPDQREAHAAMKMAVARPELANAGPAQSEPARQTSATTAVANAIAAVADQAVAQATNVTTPAARTQPAESAATPGLAVSWQASSHQDAPMTGQDQGQSRQSPEFTRFAAALAQVTSAGVEDGGRTASAVVAPVASTTTPAAGAAHTPVATGAAVPASTADTPAAENVGRLVQAMRVISRPGAWEANVRLKPEHLGEVSIAVRVERNTVSAVVNAEAAGVRQWLESQEQSVRTGMAEHGLHLERFVVQRDGQRRDAEPQQQESRRQSPRRQAVPTERFEIVV